MQSQDERDAESFAARRERDGVVKKFPDEEITGRYEGEELEERRSQRTDVVKEEKVDTVKVKAKADRRKRNLKILGLLAGGGGLIELIHRLMEYI
jgi:hypothetical protein